MRREGVMGKFFYVGLAVSAVLVLILALQKKELAEQNAKLAREQYYLKIGDWLPSMALKDLNGDYLTIADVKNERQVLLYFTTQCAHCIASIPFIREISRVLKRDGIQFIGVTPEVDIGGVRKFLKSNDLDFPVVSIPNRRDQGLIQFRMSPTLVVLSRGGRVERVHVGRIYSDKDAFGVILSSRQKEIVGPSTKALEE
ncbi:TlpA family protein disulfide reductase [Xanthomonas sp. AmX2]|uniref:TlpA family protein disulfide reductase n=1 Tax=Xanthomonas sp. TaxID=29446 RepID=UPI0019806817|nr:TlpA disulfide reductase family protein [Xanthomonas sp.]MBN6152111.1 TlpA family protein disulfide reductase [Xanthomonas sp.]